MRWARAIGIVARRLAVDRHTFSKSIMCSRCHGFVHESSGAFAAAPAHVFSPALAPAQLAALTCDAPVQRPG
jgi:hypothetical protein